LLHSNLHLFVEFAVELILKHFESLINLFLECIHTLTHLLVSSIIISCENIINEAVYFSSAGI
jgi:hypothetical protein